MGTGDDNNILFVTNNLFIDYDYASHKTCHIYHSVISVVQSGQVGAALLLDLLLHLGQHLLHLPQLLVLLGQHLVLLVTSTWSWR